MTIKGTAPLAESMYQLPKSAAGSQAAAPDRTGGEASMAGALAPKVAEVITAAVRDATRGLAPPTAGLGALRSGAQARDRLERSPNPLHSIEAPSLTENLGVMFESCNARPELHAVVSDLYEMLRIPMPPLSDSDLLNPDESTREPLSNDAVAGLANKALSEERIRDLFRRWEENGGDKATLEALLRPRPFPCSNEVHAKPGN
jgi:hypothetical protein